MNTALRLTFAATAFVCALSALPTAQAAAVCVPLPNGTRYCFLGLNGPEASGIRESERLQAASTNHEDALSRRERAAPSVPEKSGVRVESVLLPDGREVTVR